MRVGKLLPVMFCLVYFTSYITRINYAAVLPEVVDSLGITNEMAGLAVTGGFVSYGLGQLLVGWLGDRLPPKYIITAGLLGSGLCNLTAALQGSVEVIAAVWTVNGFFQSLIWPPLIRMIAETMPEDQYRQTCINVVSAANVGTVLVYLTAPLLISLWNWRLVLLVPAAVAAAMAVLWQLTVRAGLRARAVPRRDEGTAPARAGEISTGRLILLSGVPFILGATVLQGFLRDGLTTWMPSYISEAFSLGTEVSILSTAVLPLFAIVALRVSARIYAGCRNDEMRTSVLLFFAAAAGCLVLYACFRSVPVTIAMMAVICGSGHGVNHMLISNSSVRYARYGRVATMTGILNAFAYLGSALSAYGFAAVADRWGWRPLVLVWLACACLGGVLCGLNSRRWRSFIGDERSGE